MSIPELTSSSGANPSEHGFSQNQILHVEISLIAALNLFLDLSNSAYAYANFNPIVVGSA